jgi:hypothetical protein
MNQRFLGALKSLGQGERVVTSVLPICFVGPRQFLSRKEQPLDSVAAEINAERTGGPKRPYLGLAKSILPQGSPDYDALRLATMIRKHSVSTTANSALVKPEDYTSDESSQRCIDASSSRIL